MSGQNGAKFSCGSCGRQYPWKAELAGKRAKCKCGQVLTVPASLPPELGEDPEMFDLAPDLSGGGGAGKRQKPAAPAPAHGHAPARPVVAGTGKSRGSGKAPARTAAGGGGRCPECGAAFEAGAAMCVSCGLNLITGQHVQTQVVGGEEDEEDGAGATPLPPMPGRKPRKGQTREEATKEAGDRSRVIMQVVIVAIVGLLVVGVVFAAKIYFKRSGGGAAANAGPMLADDAEAVRMIRDDGGQEAKQYLEAHEAHTFSPQWTNKQSMGKVNRWNELGAAKVWAFEGLISKNVVLELPKDAEKRKALFDWAAQFEKEKLQPIPKDVGQKYIILHTF